MAGIAFMAFMAFIVFIGAFMDVFMRFMVLMAAMNSRTVCMRREQGVAEWLGQCEIYISTCLKECTTCSEHTWYEHATCSYNVQIKQYLNTTYVQIMFRSNKI
jgi:hypothetical protein